jgi:hypothetical protein
MLPAITAHARVSFRHLKPEARAEAIAECVANAMVAFVRLVKLGKVALAYPTVLARYAVAQVKDHRRVGAKLNIKDVLSPYCQARKKVKVERLDHYDEEEGAWQEAVVQDTRSAPVPDIVSFRVDFADWLDNLSRRNRKIAQFLALGNRTSDAAHKFGVSQGRISQLRSELAESWKKFTGTANRDDHAAA